MIRSKFFSRNVNSDSNDSSDSTQTSDSGYSSSSDDESSTTVSQSLPALCRKIEELLLEAPSVEWGLIQKNLEVLQSTSNAVPVSSFDKRVIDEIGRCYISVKDALHTATKNKHAKLLESTFSKLVPGILTSEILDSLRKVEGSDSEYADSSFSYTSSESSEDELPLSRGPVSASDKWKRKEPLTPSTSIPSVSVSRKPSSRLKSERKEPEPLLPTSDEKRKIVNTEEEALARYAVILSSRGRKGADRSSQLKELEELVQVEGVAPINLLQIKLTLLSFYFEKMPASAYAQWFTTIIALLSGVIELGLEIKDSLCSTNENLLATPASLFSSLLVSLYRLDDEYQNLLSSMPAPISSSSSLSSSSGEISASSGEYLELLKLERRLYALIVNMQYLASYFIDGRQNPNTNGAEDAVHELTIRRLAHLYGKSETGIRKIESHISPSRDVSTFDGDRLHWRDVLELAGDPGTAISLPYVPATLRLAAWLLMTSKSGQVHRARALLYLVSWIVSDSIPVGGVPSPFLLGKSLILTSSIQETIMWADMYTQVLFNRTLAMLGVAAYKEGRLRPCMAMLGDLVASGRPRELLGQLSSSSISADEARLTISIPWHIWLPLDSLEIIYLLSAIIVEIPHVVTKNIVCSQFPQHLLPKPLRRLLLEKSGALQNYSDTSTTSANSRDLLVCITRYILGGDWKKAMGSLQLLRLPCTAQNLLGHIKRASLVSLIAKNGSSWTSINVKSFASSFELDKAEVISLFKSYFSDLATGGSLLGIPYLDEKEEWVYSNAMFEDDTTENKDVFGLWSVGMKLSTMLNQLSQRFNCLIQESEKTFGKRTYSPSQSPKPKTKFNY